jgi:hypothetical protein
VTSEREIKVFSPESAAPEAESATQCVRIREAAAIAWAGAMFLKSSLCMCETSAAVNSNYDLMRHVSGLKETKYVIKMIRITHAHGFLVIKFHNQVVRVVRFKVVAKKDILLTD